MHMETLELETPPDIVQGNTENKVFGWQSQAYPSTFMMLDG